MAKTSLTKPLKDTLDIFKMVGIATFQLLLPIPGIVVATLDRQSEKMRNRVRFEEIEAYNKMLNNKLNGKQDKFDKEFINGALLFRLEDIAAKMLKYPKQGWAKILSDYVSESLLNMSYPVDAKSLILSSLLELDMVDILVLKQVYIQGIINIDNNVSPGVKFQTLIELMKNSGIDSIMIERSIDRLQAQSLVKPFNNSTATLQEMLSKDELLEGKRSEQFYPGGGYLYTTYGSRFVKFLKIDS